MKQTIREMNLIWIFVILSLLIGLTLGLVIGIKMGPVNAVGDAAKASLIPFS